MRDHRITDDEASAVLRGETPAARPDLAAVADAVSMFRRASFETPPQPSAELALRLDLERAERISASAHGMNESMAVTALASRATTPGTRRRRVSLSGFVGLGLAAKIAIGAGAAAAIGVTGTGAAGFAGVLPTGAQHVFNQVTGQVSGGSDSGVQNTEVGVETSQDVRVEAGLETDGAEQAVQNGLETAEEQRQAAVDAADELVQTGRETAEELVQTGRDTADELGQTGRETAEELGRTGREVVDGADDIADVQGGVGVDVEVGVSGN